MSNTTDENTSPEASCAPPSGSARRWLAVGTLCCLTAGMLISTIPTWCDKGIATLAVLIALVGQNFNRMGMSEPNDEALRLRGGKEGT